MSGVFRPATSVLAFLDPLGILNLSVWETVEDLFEYVYRSAHTLTLRTRKEWFEPYGSPCMALWWVITGHIPTVEEAKEKLNQLSREDPSPEVFTFKNRFPAPDSAPARI